MASHGAWCCKRSSQACEVSGLQMISMDGFYFKAAAVCRGVMWLAHVGREVTLVSLRCNPHGDSWDCLSGKVRALQMTLLSVWDKWKSARASRFSKESWSLLRERNSRRSPFHEAWASASTPSETSFIILKVLIGIMHVLDHRSDCPEWCWARQWDVDPCRQTQCPADWWVVISPSHMSSTITWQPKLTSFSPHPLTNYFHVVHVRHFFKTDLFINFLFLSEIYPNPRKIWWLFFGCDLHRLGNSW